MAQYDDRIAKLRAFGFSDYAARVYVALVDLGPSAAREICTASHVPSSKIYHVLENLHGRGLVSIAPGFPKRYEAVPIADFLGKMHSFHVEAASSIAADRENLIHLFSTARKILPGPVGGLATLSGRGLIMAKWASMVEAARADIIIAAAGPFAQVLPSSEKLLVGAAERGVRTHIVVPKGVSLSATLAWRATPHQGTLSVVCADSERALLITADPSPEHGAPGVRVDPWGAVEARGAGAAGTFAHLFEREWAALDAAADDGPGTHSR
ncbi:MAG: TrmB family transcriptional regulator [Thermoplasmatota archaeon]